MQALDPFRHASGGDPLDLGHGIRTGRETDPLPLRQIIPVRGLVGVRDLVVLCDPVGHLVHQPRGLQP